METIIQTTEPQIIQPVFRKIHEIRGLRVMMDYELAELYGVETKQLKRAVNRNIERFPKDFMFQLTRKEHNNILRSQFVISSLQFTENDNNINLRCQSGTSSLQLSENENDMELSSQSSASSSYGGTRYLPYAFTEQGVAMLSGVIHSPMAIAANIAIMRAFVALRQYALNYADLSSRLEEFMKSTDSNFSEVFDVLEELTAQKKLYDNRKPIGFIVRDDAN